MASGKGKEPAEKGCLQSKGIRTISVVQEDKSSFVRQAIDHVFESPLAKVPLDDTGEPVELSSLSQYIENILEQTARENSDCLTNECQGKLGPSTVEFDYSGSFGTLAVEADRLGVSSENNFSTIRANCCVYKGKWMYELLLGSKGVMQVGWCTAKCKFSEEDGAGDTLNSFAYDGSRVQKWNNKMHSKYGEGWLAGDIITCAIDCDNGIISFFRNGFGLGEAFTEVPLGPGFAYFPAVSLSHTENLRANFGSTPLRYPVDGHLAIQDPPTVGAARARRLLFHVDRFIPLITSALQVEDEEQKKREIGSRSQKATLAILGAQLVGSLAPHLRNAFVVESCLIQVLLDKREDRTYVDSLLDLLFSFLQEQELKQCMENLMISLLSNYRFSPVLDGFIWQKKYLTLLRTLLQHDQTRKYLLKNVLFDKIKFPVFLHIKPSDDKVLAQMIPRVWLNKAPKEDAADLDDHDLDDRIGDLSAEEKDDRDRYKTSCNVLRTNVKALEEIQVDIVKLLLKADDAGFQEDDSSRRIFHGKFREFLKENIIPPHIKVQQINHCPPLVQLCFFNRLVRALQHHWKEDHERRTMPRSSEQHITNEALVPSKIFNDDSLDYFDCQRLGGLLSHLKKTQTNTMETDDCGSSLEITGSHKTLVEIIDGVIMLYNMTAHKQLGKMCSLRDTFHEYVKALVDVEKKIASCPADLRSVLLELQNARRVFLEKVVEQARHMAWIVCVIYTEEAQADVHWLMQTVLRTLRLASARGQFYGFVPDFYVEACINTYSALNNYFNPIVRFTSISGHEDSLRQYATFLSNNFADPRIVNSDIQDTLIQALACFVCYPMSLSILETMTSDNCLQMTKALLAPYENRPWAQTNWILLRLWKGCGFAYRYRHLPHLKPLKNREYDQSAASLQNPCPSKVFQGYVQAVLETDGEGATKLLDTILNQLNWAFSEFISMLQELHQLIAQPSILLVDSRRLKICATCFDISVGLLRVIEMIVHLNPRLFTDWSKPDAELLLRRLFQLLAQVLNRVTCKSNTFEMIVVSAIPGLDSVDHFPILAAVAGILTQLVVKSTGPGQENAVVALLAEPGFQLNSVDFLLGGGGGSNELPASSEPSNEIENAFSLADYKEVSAEEEHDVEQLVSILNGHVNQTQRQDIEEDMLCSICYAQIKTVKFIPCMHQSCRSCITQHRMNKNECFFCKLTIIDVVNIDDDDNV